MTIAPSVAERASVTAEGASAGEARSAGALRVDDDLLPATRVLLLAFALLTGLAAHQLLVLGGHTDRWWAWTITGRPTTAFLGAAYAAGCVLSVLALRQRSWSRVHITVKTVAVFTSLTLVATIVHAHRLHLWAADPVPRAAAWFWLAVYIAVPAVCVGVVLLQEGRGSSRAASVGRALPRWLRRLLAVQGAAMFAAGAVLFSRALTVHHGAVTTGGIWPWTLSPLGAEAVGAWLMAFGVGAALVIRERDLHRLVGPAVAYSVFGALQLAVLVGYHGEVIGGAATVWLWAALYGTAVLTGGYGWRAVARQPAIRRALL
jgi:hypothetical protein